MMDTNNTTDDALHVAVGRLPTLNQDIYPGLGGYWVQLRLEPERNEVVARIYGVTPQQAVERAKQVKAALDAARQPAEVAPIPMLLFCPRCHTQHIDKAEEGDGRRGPPNGVWNNPPHRSHLCSHCGCTWRPADVATTGVAAIATRGSADNFDLPSQV